MRSLCDIARDLGVFLIEQKGKQEEWRALFGLSRKLSINLHGLAVDVGENSQRTISS